MEIAHLYEIFYQHIEGPIEHVTRKRLDRDDRFQNLRGRKETTSENIQEDGLHCQALRRRVFQYHQFSDTR